MAVIVEHHPSVKGEDGYTLEVFNTVGATITVVTASEREFSPLSEDEIFSVRRLEAV